MTDDPRNPAPGPDRFDDDADAAFDAWLRASGIDAGVAERLADAGADDSEVPGVPGIDGLPPLPDAATIDAQIARALDEAPVAEPVVPPVASLAQHRETRSTSGSGSGNRSGSRSRSGNRSRFSRWSVPIGAVAASAVAIVGFGVLVAPGGDDETVQTAAVEADEATDAATSNTRAFSSSIESDAIESEPIEEAAANPAGAAVAEAPADTDSSADTDSLADTESLADTGPAETEAPSADDGAPATPPGGDTGLEILPDDCRPILDDVLADLGGDGVADGVIDVVPGDEPNLVEITIESADGQRLVIFDTGLCERGDPVIVDVPVG